MNRSIGSGSTAPVVSLMNSVGADAIDDRVSYHPPNALAVECHTSVRNAIMDAMSDIDAYVPVGREKALAFTKLEEAMMWANAGIARHHAAIAAEASPAEASPAEASP